MLSSTYVALLKDVYQYSMTDASDIDDTKYILNKKIVEVNETSPPLRN
jgi:hypothetical protein